MAKFELGILHNEIKIPFTMFDTNIDNNILEWFQEKTKYTYFNKENISTYNYSSDEQLVLHKNSKAELSFKMQKFIVIDDNFTFNPFINRIHNGTIIYLRDITQTKIKLFWVNNIAYTFSKINISYDIKCQDIFSYIYSRRNNGYQIKNDINDIDFLGAKTIDEWAEKITKECKIQYNYIGIEDKHIDGIKKVYYDNDNQLAFTYDATEIKKDDNLITSKNYLEERQIDNNKKYIGVIKDKEVEWTSEEVLPYIKNTGYNYIDKKEKCWISEEQKKVYNISLAFSVSNSNAYNALVSLTQQAGLILQIDDLTKTFWFKPEKNEQFNGWYYSPNVDLKTFSLSQAGDTLVSVLNVEPRTLSDNQIITLIPDDVFSIISTLQKTTEDRNNQYYNYLNSYYSDLIKIAHNKDVTDYLTADEKHLLDTLNKIPWLDNKIINLNYFENFKLISEEQFRHLYNLLYNDLRRANINLLFYSNIYNKDKDDYINAVVNSQELIDRFLADFTANIIKIKAPKGEEAEKESTEEANRKDINIEQLKENYKNVLWKAVSTKNSVINYHKQINQYALKLYNSQQRFLQAAYLFNKKKEEAKLDTIPKEGNTALIEDLLLQWQTMKDYSWHCEYFIPETGLKLEGNNYIFINSSYVPQVSKKTQQNKKNKFILSTGSNTNANTSSASFLNKYIPVDQHWDIEENEYLKVDEYFVENNTGVKWTDLNTEWHLEDVFGYNNNRPIHKIFSGINSMQLCYWLNYYQAGNNQSEIDYENAIKQQRAVWEDIYSQYGNYLLEQNYQDKYALNSDELYQNASLYFKDISSPENQYNLSIINVAALKGYKGDEIQISDQIRLGADEFYGENDDLKEIIRQPLFITDINYNLRSDKEIKLTVNTVKYQDKVIQRLVSLIK